MTSTNSTGNEVARPARTPAWVVAAELASIGLMTWYVYLMLYPDGTERGMRAWSLASKALYGSAALCGQAGMACERRYLSLTNAGG